MSVEHEELEFLAAALTVLGALHRHAPDPQVLDSVREMVGQWPLPARGETGQGVSDLTESAAIGEDSPLVVRDHDRLYGDSAVARVAPYESVHRGREGLVFGEETLQVRDAYRVLGLQVAALNREPDDHVGVELDFLARCFLAELDARDRGDEVAAQRVESLARSFIAEHVLTWMPDALSQVAQQASTSFMRGVAHLSLGAIDEVVEAFGIEGPDRSRSASRTSTVRIADNGVSDQLMS